MLCGLIISWKKVIRNTATVTLVIGMQLESYNNDKGRQKTPSNGLQPFITKT
jgi:hypothetical protein